MLNERQKELVLNNMRLVYKVAVERGKLGDEDAIQSGFTGLCKAAENYDETKGNAFSTYAYSYIKWWIDGSYSDKKLEEQIRIGGITFVDDLTEYDRGEIDDENKRLVRELLSTADDFSREIIKLMYLGYTKSQIKKKMSISSRKLNKEIEKVKEKFIDGKEE